MYTVCTFTMFCTYNVYTLYVHLSYNVRTRFRNVRTRFRNVCTFHEMYDASCAPNIWNPDTLDEIGHTRSYSVCTVFIPSMTMPYDEHCMYLVILAIVRTSLYILVHTDRCQKSKVHTVYVQNA